MFGLDLVTVGGLLVLATNSIQCKVPEAPHISVTPVTNEIQYDFSYSSEELGTVKLGTESPYGANVDSSTGGLRHDKPLINTSISWGIQTYRYAGASCMWYQNIDVKIVLSPQIFISRDYKSQTCREAILQHEERHVQVDREVINKYARELGAALQTKIRSVGAVGPYNESRQKEMQDVMTQYIQDTIDAQEAKLNTEMTARQALVDSVTEYDAVSNICNQAEFKEQMKQKGLKERNSNYNR